MTNTISLLQDEVSTQERIADFLSVASAMLSGVALLLAVAVTF